MILGAAVDYGDLQRVFDHVSASFPVAKCELFTFYIQLVKFLGHKVYNSRSWNKVSCTVTLSRRGNIQYQVLSEGAGRI